MNNSNTVQPIVTYRFLVTFFLKIGTISFGGFMALIGIIQRELVIKEGKMDDKTLMDGITLASMLPGPLAVNTVCFIGYKLRGFWGAIVSMTAVILPSFILVVIFAYGYYQLGGVDNINELIKSVIPAILAIIVTVGISMHKKHVTELRQYPMLILSIVLLQLIGGVLITVLLICMGGLVGLIIYRKELGVPQLAEHNISFSFPRKLIKNVSILLGICGIILLSSYLIDPSGELYSMNFQILGVFSSMSLSLFGGGYVIIPIIREAIVGGLEWLTIEEFNTALGISQATPGPILVSATFIGYKMAGILGAIIATIAIFFPSGLLMIVLSNSMEKLKDSKYVAVIFRGIRPVIVGLIYSAALSIAFESLNTFVQIILFSIFTLLILKYNFSSIKLILISLIVGVIQFLI